MTGTPWWHPERHADRAIFLRHRGRVKRGLLDWFDAEGFTEVECGILQVSPGNETHLHAFQTDFVDDVTGRRTPFFLHTSPEFSCKKLLAAGEEKIFDFARVFRNREGSPLHSPEFTMVEWYRKGAKLPDIMADTVALAQIACNVCGQKAFVCRGRMCDPMTPPEYLTLTEAFTRYAGIDLDGLLDDRDGFAQAAQRAGVGISEASGWSDIFSAVLVTLIEPRLGDGRLTFLYRYPLCEAALARACSDDPRYADRFEMYACGVELANGFDELTDAVEQRARFEADMALKLELYGERYPLDEDFLEALHDMPAASGVALGFERLVMLASGARDISDVIWTPFRA